ncbi:uncharacterized protein [Clytia hemisphaerica]|uniref:Uncharacterized protein n=1 Tax=Clytia hemisphaerica TaxID=252671 RepID=A0A7M6DN30_9CNID
MTKTIVFTLLMLFVFQVIEASSDDCPDGIRDIAIVFETPRARAMSEVEDLKRLYVSLHKNDTASLKCIHYSLVVADDIIDIIQSLDCQSKRCFDQSLEALDKVTEKLSNDVAQDGDEYKRNFIKSIQDINTTIFSENAGGRPQAEKTVLLLLTQGKHEDHSITKVASKLLNDPKFHVLAVGIGKKARNEELIGAAKYPNRILSVNTIRELFPGKPGYDIIYRLLENPSYDRFAVQNIPKQLDECDFVADVGFLIDASNSIREDYLSELQFVKLVTASYGISKEGSHAGAVIYSDFGRFSTASIKFTDHFSTPSFLKSVEKVEHFGFRTRIDLAFLVAQDQLFTVKGGMRPGKQVKKIIYLITDGEQNPKRSGNRILDPVAASQKFYDDGVIIFAIGVGPLVNKDELERITRDPSRVFLANHPNELAGIDFVYKLASTSCKDAVPFKPTTTMTTTTTPTTSTTTTATTTTTTTTTEETTTMSLPPPPAIKESTPCPTKAKPKCQGVGTCGECCPGQQIYLNLFFPGGNGKNYVMQGTQQLARTKDGKATIVLENDEAANNNGGSVVNGDYDKTKIMNLIRSKLPNGNEVLFNSIEEIISSYHQSKNGDEGDSNIPVNRRNRRDIGLEKHQQNMMSLAEKLGCKEFMHDLQKYGIFDNLHEVQRIMKTKITVLCPVDQQYKAFKKTNKAEDRKAIVQILLDHVVRRMGTNGNLLHSISTRSKIIIQKHFENKAEMVNNAKIIVSIKLPQSLELTIIDSMIDTPIQSVMDVLRSTPSLSTMYEIIKGSHLKKILKGAQRPTEICFHKKLCIGISKDLANHFQELASFKQFTFQFLENDIFKTPKIMPKHYRKKFMTSSKARNTFVEQHVFLGIHDNEKLTNESKERMLGLTMNSKHPIVEFLQSEGGRHVTRNGAHAFRIRKMIRVKEGLVQILSPLD